MRIIINPNSEDKKRSLTVTDEVPEGDIKDIIRAHGEDPDKVDWKVKKGVQSRLKMLEQSVGASDEKSKKGVAHRIDKIEDEIQKIKDEIGLS